MATVGKSTTRYAENFVPSNGCPLRLMMNGELKKDEYIQVQGGSLDLFFSLKRTLWRQGLEIAYLGSCQWKRNMYYTNTRYCTPLLCFCLPFSFPDLHTTYETTLLLNIASYFGGRRWGSLVRGSTRAGRFLNDSQRRGKPGSTNCDL